MNDTNLIATRSISRWIIIIIKRARQYKPEREIWTLSVRRPRPHNTVQFLNMFLTVDLLNLFDSETSYKASDSKHMFH